MKSDDDTHHLRMLRARIDRLRDILYAALNGPAVPLADWPLWCDRFGALAQQFRTLQAECAAFFSRPMADMLIVPAAPAAEDLPNQQRGSPSILS